MVLGAMDSFKMLASRLAIISGKPKSVVLSEWYSRLNLHLEDSRNTLMARNAREICNFFAHLYLHNG